MTDSTAIAIAPLDLQEQQDYCGQEINHALPELERLSLVQPDPRIPIEKPVSKIVSLICSRRAIMKRDMLLCQRESIMMHSLSTKRRRMMTAQLSKTLKN